MYRPIDPIRHVTKIPTMDHFLLAEWNMPIVESEFDPVWPEIQEILHYGNVVSMPYLTILFISLDQ